MILIEMREFEKVSSRKKDKDEWEKWEKKGKPDPEMPAWRYVKNLPRRLEEKDIVQQQELKGGQIDASTGKKKGSRLIIEDESDGLRITAKGFVGIAFFSKFSISVEPKYVRPENLARLIEFAYGLDPDIELRDNEVMFESDKENWLIALLVRWFMRKCDELIRKGLYKSYQTQIDDLTYLRGKLIMKQQIKNDFKKKLAFNCEFDELVTSNKENQICLHVLEDKCYRLLRERSKDPNLRRTCNTLIKRFSMEVERTLEEGRTELIKNDFKNIVYNRLNERYKSAHMIGKMIWENAGISDLYKFAKSNVNSLFLPMYEIHEKFLEKLFETKFAKENIRSQKTKPAWKKLDETTLDIRTDLLLYEKSDLKYLVDAKYKSKLTSTDRFELGFYIHEFKDTDRFPGKEAFAILPIPRDHKAETPDDSITSEQQGITIHIKHVDVNDMLDLIYGQGSGTTGKEKCEECGKILVEHSFKEEEVCVNSRKSRLKDEVDRLITP